jgi:hypothetical protein
MAKLRISHAFGSLVPEPGPRRVFGLSTLVNTFGFGLVWTVMMIGLVLSLGRAGWIGLGVLFVLLGLGGPAVARWGERTRPVPVAVGEDEHAVVGQ